MINKNIADPNSRISRAINNKSVQGAITRLTNPRNLASALALESTVIVGRSVQSYRRGGLIELKERIFEETATAAVWLFGVKVIGDAIDFIAKKAKIDTSLDMVNQKLANKPAFLASKNIDPLKKMTNGLGEGAEKTLVASKLGKMFVSSALAIYAVGSVIPKINQARTRRLIAEEKKQNEIKNQFNNINLENNSLKPAETNNEKISTFSSMNHFLNSTGKKNEQSFTGALDVLKTVGYMQENNDMFKLLTVDTGVTGGRAAHARNKDEMREILVRDVGSIPFYLLTTPLISKGLAKLFNDKNNINTDLDSKVVDVTNNKIRETLKNTGNENIKKVLLGNDVKEEHIDILTKLAKDSGEHKGKILFEDLRNKSKELNLDVSDIETNFKKYARLNRQSYASDDLIKLANENKSDSLMKFAESVYARTYSGNKLKRADLKNELTALKLDDNLTSKAVKLIDGIKKSENNPAFIIKEQVEHVIKGGMVNDSGFLGKAYTHFEPEKTPQDFFSKLISRIKPKDSPITNITNPRSYTSASKIEDINKNIIDYTKKFIVDLEKRGEKNTKNIEASLLRMKNTNMLAKTGYFAAGFGVSAFFLSIVIPRIQCQITKIKTGRNEFPGIMEDSSNNKIK